MKTRDQSVSYQVGSTGYSGNLPFPVECPLCHYAAHISLLHGPFTKAGPGVLSRLEAVFKCPHPECGRIFIGVYEGALKPPFDISAGSWTISFWPSKHIAHQFHPKIRQISSQFITIFDQAEAAEHAKLDLVCGAGYRKSLEFLLKDFLAAKHPAQADRIKTLYIGPLINEFVQDPLLKIVAERAAWLGNDETHYIRKWADKELSDLKQLIELATHWIVADLITAELPASMPKGSAPAQS